MQGFASVAHSSPNDDWIGNGEEVARNQRQSEGGHSRDKDALVEEEDRDFSRGASGAIDKRVGVQNLSPEDDC